MSTTSIRLLGRDAEQQVTGFGGFQWTSKRFPFQATVSVDSHGVNGTIGPNNWVQLQSSRAHETERDDAQDMAHQIDEAAKRLTRDARWYLT